jgi:hypothetical protein
MPVKQAARICWWAKFPGAPSYITDGHWATETATRLAATRAAEDQPGTVIETGKFPALCLVAECDGECGCQLDNGDGEPVHFDGGMGQLREYAALCGWVIDGDRVFCEDDRPAGLGEPEGMDPLPGLEVIPGA